MHVDKQVRFPPHVFVFTKPCMHLEVTQGKASKATSVIAQQFCCIGLALPSAGGQGHCHEGQLDHEGHEGHEDNASQEGHEGYEVHEGNEGQ